MDCFAELVIGPATSGRTSWFAITNHSRGAPLRPSYHRTLIRWSIRTSSRQTLGGKRLTCFTAAWIAGSSPGNDERERTKEIRRRNADRRNEYSAVANGHGRACKRPGAHLSAFHRGSRPKESFIARDSAPGFIFLGLGGQFGWPSSGRYPPLPVPVQRTQSRPGHSAEGLMPECRPGAGCKAARGHRTRAREPGLPPGRDRIIGRGYD